ncbi:Ig-like domain-containing protein [Caulobacter sp. S45]|uniref:Ig-like domain-containing protein n=1 Tax=Caulobacter sp. S45 TaxID=1641861 RepID=UPI0015755243|nr:Ig-like domain-containing protein [Caulobacter sp. S45]
MHHKLDLDGASGATGVSPSDIVNNGVLTLDQDSLDALNGASYREIVTWGDSLTAGNGAGQGNQYPSILAADFNYDRAVLNEGKGGDTSTEIVNRLVAATSLLNDTVVIWAGRNNNADPTTVMADIARAVSALGSNTHYVILSILNADAPNEAKGGSGYEDIVNLNSQLASTYPGHYLDVRSILVSDYDPSSPTDVVDHNNDVVPTSLRVNDGHLNAAGNAIVASALHDLITSKLDGPPPPRFTISGSGTISTAASTFDLTGFDTDQNTIGSTNALGTTFTVDNTSTALHVVGGSGFDTVIDTATNLTSSQRTTLFSQGVEDLVEQDGSFLAPGASPPPVITGLADDTGISSTDGLTDQISPTLVGSAPIDSMVSIYIATTTGKSTLYGQTQAGADGKWSFNFTAPADETRDFTATSSSSSGPVSVSSNTFQVVVDTTPPPQPSVTSILPSTGASTGGGTSAQVMTFEGMATEGIDVNIYVDGKMVGATESRSTGTWDYYNAALVLNNGPHSVYVTAEDNAGNISTHSAVYNIIVVTPLSAPSIATVNGSSASSAGEFDVRGSGLILAGTGVAGDTVTLSVGDETIGSAVVQHGGEVDVRLQLPPARRWRLHYRLQPDRLVR